MNAETKCLRFEKRLRLADRKTDVYDVTSRETGSVLGRVAWWPAWRRYVFYPRQATLTLFDAECLRSIVAFIDKLMAARPKRRTKQEMLADRTAKLTESVDDF